MVLSLLFVASCVVVSGHDAATEYCKVADQACVVTDHDNIDMIQTGLGMNSRVTFGRRAAKAGVLPDANLPDNEYFSALRSFIVKTCGEACEMKAASGKGKFFDTVVKPNQCEALFTEDMTALDGLSNRWPPPRHIPDVMVADFNMGMSAMKVDDWYIEQNAGSNPEQKSWTTKWLKDDIDTRVQEYTAGNFRQGAYIEVERRMIHDLFEKHKADLSGKHCAVLGSQSPWVEALLLSVGVSQITTIEYADLKSEHPQITTIHPYEWADWYQKNGQANPFDCVVSYSSLEHAGLGRYGDVVNPWGDFIAMGKLTCSVKKDGLVFVGYPTGDDHIAWNSHRYYGPTRWAQMLANTEQIEYEHPPSASFSQGMVVARKI